MSNIVWLVHACSFDDVLQGTHHDKPLKWLIRQMINRNKSHGSPLLHLHQSSTNPNIRTHIQLRRHFSSVSGSCTYPSLVLHCIDKLLYDTVLKWKTRISLHDFLMTPPDWYLSSILITDHRTHYGILCISLRVIFRKQFSLPLQKFLNKFNCLHPPSEMTLCDLLHN